MYITGRQGNNSFLKGMGIEKLIWHFFGDRDGILSSASSIGFFFIWSIIEMYGKEDDEIIKGKIYF